LPERRLHRALAAERRHNAAAADAFFARKRSRGEVARIREQDLPTPPELVHALEQRSETRRVVRQILAVAEFYFTEHELELRARVAEISRTRFRAGLLPLDVYTEPRRRALEVASTGYLRRSAVSQPSSLAVFLADVGSCEADTRHPALIPWPLSESRSRNGSARWFGSARTESPAKPRRRATKRPLQCQDGPRWTKGASRHDASSR